MFFSLDTIDLAEFEKFKFNIRNTDWDDIEYRYKNIDKIKQEFRDQHRDKYSLREKYSSGLFSSETQEKVFHKIRRRYYEAVKFIQDNEPRLPVIPKYYLCISSATLSLEFVTGDIRSWHKVIVECCSSYGGMGEEYYDMRWEENIKRIISESVTRYKIDIINMFGYNKIKWDN